MHLTTKEWAESLNIPVEAIPPPVEAGDYPRTAYAVAVRAVILQGVVAVGYKVNPQPVIEWFHEQNIWEAVSPQEQAFLLAAERSDELSRKFTAHQEAEWALLWMLGKVEALGLPTHYCDSKRLVDDIIPPLSSELEVFFAAARLRPASVLLGEDLRTYDLWCKALQYRRESKPLPTDLNWTVLYERRYAFEWLDSADSWDAVTCDA